MIRKFYTAMACLLACLIVSPAMAEVKEWTSADGKTIKGEYVDSTEDSVTLLIKGKEKKFKLSKFSEEDQEAIKELKSQESKQKVNNNFSSKWPSNTKMEDKLKAKAVSEEDGEYIYETSHFRFISPAKLNVQTVSEMGRIFEGTFSACKSIPLNFPCRRYNFNKDVDADDGEQQEKLVARLFLTKADYAKETGPAMADSAGLYRGAQGDVLVPFESLGITKKGSAYAIGTGKKQDAGTLVHELTHQMSLHGATYEVPIWFAEGLAEYMNLSYATRGVFKFNAGGIEKALKPYIIGGPGVASRSMGKSFSSPSLKEFMTQPTAQFQAASGKEIQFNYGFSTLLFYYFAHLDGKGDAARLKRWMRALQDTKRASVMIPGNATPAERAAAQERLRQMTEQNDYCYDKLLDGRSWDELEAEFAKKVRKLGIEVKFR